MRGALLDIRAAVYVPGYSENSVVCLVVVRIAYLEETTLNPLALVHKDERLVVKCELLHL